MRRHSIKRDAEAFQLVSGFAPVGLIGAQDQVGLERHDLLQIGIEHGAHVRQGSRLRGVVTIIRVAHQPVPKP